MKNRKKSFAVIRLIAALAVAAVLLAVTGFAFTDLLGGAAAVTDSSELTDGKYVSVDVTYIMGFVCKETSNASGEAVNYYAAAPVGNRFVVFCFPASDYEDALALYNATDAYLHGTGSMDVHMPVTGMVSEMTSSVYSALYQWFDDNQKTMSDAGIIGTVSDYADYLSPLMVRVDAVGAMPWGWSVGLTAAAAVLVLYALAELGMVLAGVYKAPEKKPGKNRKDKAEKLPKKEKKAAAPAAPAEPAAPAVPAPPAEKPVPATELPVSAAPAEPPEAARQPAEEPEDVPVLDPAPAKPIEDEHV